MKIIALILLALYSAPMKAIARGGFTGGGFPGGFGGGMSGAAFGGGRAFGGLGGGGRTAGKAIGVADPPPILPPPIYGDGFRGGVLPPPLVTVGNGYRGGNLIPIDIPGGDATPAVVITPRWQYYPAPTAPGKIPLPQGPSMPYQPAPRPRCGRGACINKYIYGGVGGPKRSSPCCPKFKEAVECLCRFYQSQDTKKDRAVRAIFRGCRIDVPQCPSKLYRLD